MFQRILVPLDGTPRAERALPVAAQLARNSGGLVVLLQVVGPPTYYGGAAMGSAAILAENVVQDSLVEVTRYLEGVARSKELLGVETKIEVAVGVPAKHILEVVQKRGIDLVVMCSHGRTGVNRLIVGSIAHEVVHHCPVPMLIMRDNEPLPTEAHVDASHPLRALVALDGSPFAETALLPAANLISALAAPARGALHLVSVVRLSYPDGEKVYAAERGEEGMARARAYLTATAEHLRNELKDSGPVITCTATFADDIAGALFQAAQSTEEVAGTRKFSDCDIIAMTTHGRGVIQRKVLGSVTEGVLNAAELPVLVVQA